MLVFNAVSLFILTRIRVQFCMELSDEARLYRDLSKKFYYRRARPVQNSTDVVNVTVNLQLLSLTLDVRNQRMTSSIWLEQRWKDDFIKWNPSNYGGVNYAFLDATSIWKPDIMLRNHVGMRMHSYEEDLFVLEINSTGHVLFWPAREITTKCEIDASYYPFDTQLCSIEVGKWYSYDQIVDIIPGCPKIIMTFYTENEEWEVLDNTVNRKTTIENHLNYSQIVYSVSLKRRPLFAIVHVILPILFLSFLNNMCFLLPIESGEKTGMCMAIFLTFAVFMTLISESLPQSSINIPIYGIYLLIQNFFSALTIALEVFVIHIYHSTACRITKSGILLSYFLSLFGNKTLISKNRSFRKDCGEDQIENEDVRKTSVDDFINRSNDHALINDNVQDRKNLQNTNDLMESEEDKKVRKQSIEFSSIQTAVQLDKIFGRSLFFLNVSTFLVFLAILTNVK